MRRAGFGVVDEALGHAAERMRPDLISRDPPAQDRIVEPAIDASEGLESDLGQRWTAILPQSHVGNHLALVAEQILGDLPPLVHRAEHIRFRHANIVEEGLAKW